jgi:hypothetical protein
MQEAELFLVFIRPLNELEISYMVTGSVAAMLYGEPRLTHDVDLVLQIQPSDIVRLAELFPLSDFYFPPEEVVRTELARRVRGHFNVIEHKSGFKADCYPTGADKLHAWAFELRNRVEVGGADVWLAPPEYVILRKLEYFREGGSEKHLHDIRGMLASLETEVSRETIGEKASELGLSEQWALAEAGR